MPFFRKNDKNETLAELRRNNKIIYLKYERTKSNKTRDQVNVREKNEQKK